MARPGPARTMRAGVALCAATAVLMAPAAAEAGLPVQVGAVGGMWGFFLTETPVVDYATAKTSDTARFARLFHALLAEGVYIAPSQFEACFTSTAHDADALAATTDAFVRAFAAVRPSVDDA